MIEFIQGKIEQLEPAQAVIATANERTTIANVLVLIGL